MNSTQLISVWVGSVSFLLWMVVRTYRGINLNRKCGGYLARATAANTIVMAKTELGMVVHYMERYGMTKGFTSILYRTPDEDVGFFYRNLRESYNQLKVVQQHPPDAAHVSMILTKLRTSIQDMAGPEGIHLFPHNKMFAVWGTLSALLALWPLVMSLIALRP